MDFPPHIQALIDQGLAYEDMDGCVRMLPAYCQGGFNEPNIHIHIHTNCGNTYNTYNTYNFYGDHATNNDIHENTHSKIY